METTNSKTALISGASIAGLSTAWWLKKSGYRVSIIELAGAPRTAGAAVDIRGTAVDAVKRMGLHEKMKSVGLHVDRVEFKNESDETEGAIVMSAAGGDDSGDEIEIERDQFVRIMLEELGNEIEFIFNSSITGLEETGERITATFKTGIARSFDLVVGCDGAHSAVRKIRFGDESKYAHFLGAYFSIGIVDKLLVKQKTMQLFNVPGKAIMLNAYNNKTDIIFCFTSEKEIPYDYRDSSRQWEMIAETFSGVGWRTSELLAEMERSGRFYFDRFCQIKMSSWSEGRVVLVGDAGYAASPAAGMGASLSLSGAAALADGLQKHGTDFKAAFRDYHELLRPFVEEIQAMAADNVKEHFFPQTDEAIRKRNTSAKLF